MKYRLYLDVVGNSDLGASRDPNHRYLSLTGIIMELNYVRDVAVPAIEKLKQKFFDAHPDEPIIFHRKELVNKKWPFEALRNPATEEAFNQELLSLIKRLDFVVLTAVIDKQEHLQRYKVWRYDPYHYCLEVLVERFVLWLERRDAAGDVLAESRGKQEDSRLKTEFEKIYMKGSSGLVASRVQARLTSKELKVRPKATNIAGLQLADLIAHPSFVATKARRHGDPLPNNFGGQIAAILEADKYDRDPRSCIDGWGRKWLP